MKTKLLVSVFLVNAALSASIANADSHMPAKETGVIESMADAVKGTVGDVKKALTKGVKAEDATASVKDDSADSSADGTDEPVEKAEKPATEDDSKDAEANREVSDTSITIFSQNPYIQSVMEKTTHIKSARLKELIARGDKITMLDIRPRAEYAKDNGIKGATLNIPRNFLEVEAYEKVPSKEAAIIIISTKGIRGGLAANTLQNMGYSNVRNLMDGLEGWHKAK